MGLKKSVFLFACGACMLVCTHWMWGCGSIPGSNSGGQASGPSVVISILNPDPDAKGTAKAVETTSHEPSGAAGKATLTKADVSQIDLTVSGSDMTTVTKTLTAPFAAIIETSLAIPAGKDRTFAFTAKDLSASSSIVTVGYEGSATATISATGTNNVSVSGKFLQLISDSTGESAEIDLNFGRISQGASNTTIDIGFGSALTNAKKPTLKGYIEFDTGESTGSNSIGGGSWSDTNRCGLKIDKYILVEGGLVKPIAHVYDSNDAKQFQVTAAWSTTSSSNTLLTLTMSNDQFKDKIDSNQKGYWCALFGNTSSYSDTLPTTSYGLYDLSKSTFDSIALAINGANCGKNGTCNSGFCCKDGKDNCPENSVCKSLTPVTLAGTVTSPYGLAGTSGDVNGTGNSARFHTPFGVAINSKGTRLYVADWGNNKIREINLGTGAVTILAGPDVGTTAGGSTDGTGNDARFSSPIGIVIDSTDTNLYVAEENHKVRKIVIGAGGGATGVVTTLAGPTGCGTLCPAGYVDETGENAKFNTPEGIGIDLSDTYLYVPDSVNNVIRRVEIATGTVTTYAGSTAGASGDADDTNGDGDGNEARFNAPLGVGMAIDPSGTYLYISDTGNSKIRKINLSNGNVTTPFGTVAGTDPNLFGGDTDCTGTCTGNESRFRAPEGLVIDPTGTFLYVGERDNRKIRKINLETKEVTTLAGPAPGSQTAGSTDGTGSAARFAGPLGLAIHPNGTIIYAGDAGSYDDRNHNIRVVK